MRGKLRQGARGPTRATWILFRKKQIAAAVLVLSSPCAVQHIGQLTAAVGRIEERLSSFSQLLKQIGDVAETIETIAGEVFTDLRVARPES